MDNQGWIKIHRKIIDTSFFKKPMVLAFFLYCVIKANHQDNKFIWNSEEITIKRGSFVSGLKVMSKESGISIQSIRTALVILKSTQTLTIKSTTKFSVITICRYDDYQSPTSPPTNKQQTSNKQATTNNNKYRMYKNEKREGKPFLKPENFVVDEKTGVYKLVKPL